MSTAIVQLPRVQRCDAQGKITQEYRAWCEMKKRCVNQNDHGYPYYGARGISVCPEWMRSFEAFVWYVGPKPSPEHSLGRIDNNGNYEPGNVEWQLRAVQENNKRSNRFVDIDGERLTIAQAARKHGLSRHRLWFRMSVQKMSAEEAVKQPVQKYAVHYGRLARHKLTADMVVEIRARFKAGESKRAIAIHFGIASSTVKRIVDGKLWSSVSEDGVDTRTRIQAVNSGEHLVDVGLPRQRKASRQPEAVAPGRSRVRKADTKSRSLTARVTPEEEQRFKAYAEEQGVEVSTLLREMILRELGERTMDKEHRAAQMLLELSIKKWERELAGDKAKREEFRRLCGEVMR